MLGSDKSIPTGPNSILFSEMKSLHTSQEASREEAPREVGYLITCVHLSIKKKAPALPQLRKPEMHQNVTALCPDSESRAHTDG